MKAKYFKSKRKKTEAEKLYKKYTKGSFLIRFDVSKTLTPYHRQLGVGYLQNGLESNKEWTEVVKIKTMTFTKKNLHRVFNEMFKWLKELEIYLLATELNIEDDSLIAERPESIDGLMWEEVEDDAQLFWVTYSVRIEFNGLRVTSKDLLPWYEEFKKSEEVKNGFF